MVIDRYGLCHPHQITLIAIGSDPLPVGMFPPDVQFSGNIFPHHTHYISAGDEHAKIVPMNYSEHGWIKPGIQEFDLSGVILQGGEGRNVSNSIVLWCSHGPGSNSFVFAG